MDYPTFERHFKLQVGEGFNEDPRLDTILPDLYRQANKNGLSAKDVAVYARVFIAGADFEAGSPRL